MSMKEFISHCAGRVVEALKNNERVERIEKDTAELLDAIASGQPLKITRTNIDPELYDELDALGAFDSNPLLNKKAPSTSTTTTTSTPITKTPRRSVAQPQIPQSHIDFDNMDKKFRENEVRLRAITQRLDEEELDDDARVILEAECSKLIAAQREMSAKKTLGLKKSGIPPPQTPIYLLGKRKQRLAAAAAHKEAATNKFFNGRRPNLKIADEEVVDEEAEQNRMSPELAATVTVEEESEVDIPSLHDE